MAGVTLNGLDPATRKLVEDLARHKGFEVHHLEKVDPGTLELLAKLAQGTAKLRGRPESVDRDEVEDADRWFDKNSAKGVDPKGAEGLLQRFQLHAEARKHLFESLERLGPAQQAAAFKELIAPGQEYEALPAHMVPFWMEQLLDIHKRDFTAAKASLRDIATLYLALQATPGGAAVEPEVVANLVLKFLALHGGDAAKAKASVLHTVALWRHVELMPQNRRVELGAVAEMTGGLSDRLGVERMAKASEAIVEAYGRVPLGERAPANGLARLTAAYGWIDSVYDYGRARDEPRQTDAAFAGLIDAVATGEVGDGSALINAFAWMVLPAERGNAADAQKGLELLVRTWRQHPEESLESLGALYSLMLEINASDTPRSAQDFARAIVEWQQARRRDVSPPVSLAEYVWVVQSAQNAALDFDTTQALAAAKAYFSTQPLLRLSSERPKTDRAAGLFARHLAATKNVEASLQLVQGLDRILHDYPQMGPYIADFLYGDTKEDRSGRVLGVEAILANVRAVLASAAKDADALGPNNAAVLLGQRWHKLRKHPGIDVIGELDRTARIAAGVGGVNQIDLITSLDALLGVTGNKPKGVEQAYRALDQALGLWAQRPNTFEGNFEQFSNRYVALYRAARGGDRLADVHRMFLGHQGAPGIFALAARHAGHVRGDDLLRAAERLFTAQDGRFVYQTLRELADALAEARALQEKKSDAGHLDRVIEARLAKHAAFSAAHRGDRP